MILTIVTQNHIADDFIKTPLSPGNAPSQRILARLWSRPRPSWRGRPSEGLRIRALEPPRTRRGDGARRNGARTRTPSLSCWGRQPRVHHWPFLRHSETWSKSGDPQTGVTSTTVAWLPLWETRNWTKMEISWNLTKKESRNDAMGSFFTCVTRISTKVQTQSPDRLPKQKMKQG